MKIVLSVSNAQLAHQFADAFLQACHPSRRDPPPPTIPVYLLPMDNDHEFRVVVSGGPSELSPWVRITFACPKCGVSQEALLPGKAADVTVQCTGCSAEIDLIPRQIVLSADELHTYTTAMEGFAKRYARLADEATSHIRGNVMNPTRRVNIRQVSASLNHLSVEVEKTTVPPSARFQEQHRTIESSIKMASQRLTAMLSV